MKTYFIECVVNYTDYYLDYYLESKPEHGTENYSFIISANTKIAAEKKAKIMAAKQFNDELNEFGEPINLRIEIEQCYETSEDARL